MSANSSSAGLGPGRRPDAAVSSHRAVLYRDRAELAHTVRTFVQAGLSEGEGILVIAPGEKLGWIRSEFDGDAPAIEFADSGAFYRSAGQATRSMVDWLRRNATGERRVRVVAEPPLARRPQVQVADYLRAEAAANVVYRPYAVSILCPYDASALHQDVLLDAQRIHPELMHDNGVVASSLFTDPRDFVRGHSLIAEPPASAASLAISDSGDLTMARHFVREEAAKAGLSAEATEYLVVAVGELVTNALIHGLPPRRLSVYADGPTLICHIYDSGPGLADPLAAYLVPERNALRGNGLWLARQMCDYLDVVTSPAGTHIVLGTALSADPEPR
jgi:anti-sigma regulatory factor (Ser/Thr protein kinase)